MLTSEPISEQIYILLVQLGDYVSRLWRVIVAIIATLRITPVEYRQIWAIRSPQLFPNGPEISLQSLETAHKVHQKTIT